MTSKWHPFADMRVEMTRLQEEMNHLFERWGVNGPRRPARGTFPAIDVWEDDNNLYVEAELPGMVIGQIEIYVTGQHQLSLKGERQLPTLEKGSWHRQERNYGVFSRLVELPTPVNADKVTAQLHQGVLTITLPKRDEVKPRRIEVTSE